MQRKYKVEPHIPGFAQFERWADKWVLDAGCGIGTDAISFALAGARVIAVDISGRSLEIAQKRAKAHGLKVQFYQADLEDLLSVVPPHPYDLVYSFGVLHHTPNPERAVGQLREFYMHDDSLLKIMLYNRYSWKVLQARGKFNVYSEAQRGSPISRTYTRRSARALLEGFDIEEMWVDHIFPYHVPSYIEYRYVKEWYWRICPFFRLLERLAGGHLLITARRNVRI